MGGMQPAESTVTLEPNVGKRGVGTEVQHKSSEQRLNLSGSWQQGHSTAYSTVFEPSRLQGIHPNIRRN